MSKRWHYVYIILYPSLGYKFYYGSRITDIHPEEDTGYFGSLVTFSCFNDPTHTEYQADAIKVVLYSIYDVPSKSTHEQITKLESRLIKEALDASHVGPELCVNRNVAGRVFATPAERKLWSARGGKISGGKNAEFLKQHLAKQFKFTDPGGKPRTIVGLRTFCREHALDPSAMRRVARGKNAKHKGWRKYAG